MFKKILYLITQWYNPYPLYWFDLLTERHLKTVLENVRIVLNVASMQMGINANMRTMKQTVVLFIIKEVAINGFL